MSRGRDDVFLASRAVGSRERRNHYLFRKRRFRRGICTPSLRRSSVRFASKRSALAVARGLSSRPGWEFPVPVLRRLESPLPALAPERQLALGSTLGGRSPTILARPMRNTIT